MGAGLLMLLDPSRRAADGRATPAGPGRPELVAIAHLERPADAAAAARDVSRTLIEAFDVDPSRREAIERETVLLLGRPEVHFCVARVDGEPAAVVRRSTFDGASYLSSIGTRPAFRGMGLGRLVTDVAIEESLALGSRWTYLGVFSDNDVARQLYERLGFVMIGGPSPDLLLRR
jgi:ribosomal protein S18 acetylase RimI-like enzyme